MIRRLKEDVLKDLPDKIRLITPIGLDDYSEYEQAKDDFISWVAKNYSKQRADRAAKAEAVTQIGYLLRLTARLKCKAVVNWANTFLEENPTEKLVLFAVHQKMIDVLQRRVKSKNVTIDGGVTGHNRKLAVDVFRRDPATRVLIGNIKAAGTGTDGLQGVCSNAAFTELWWVPGIHTQAEGRLYRIGQTMKVWIHYLVAYGTIEEQLCEILQKKQGVIREVLDGSIRAGDMDIFDALMNQLEKTQ
jgi:SWI/SNF-related matrix-associated actin-dependent regulator 1 of chromatin subfamily A